MMKTWAIGLAEMRRQSGRFDPKLLVGLAVLGVLVGGMFAFFPPDPPRPETGLWVVEADPDAVLLEAAEAEHRFRVVQGDGDLYATQQADLYLQGTRVFHHDTERSKAAIEVLEAAVRDWLNGRLSLEEDQDAAFPLSITLAYEARTLTPAAQPTPGDPDPQDPGPGDPDPSDPDPQDPDPSDPGQEEDSVLDEITPSGTVQQDIRPDQVDPPFPIRSLLLTFAYVLPASLVAQVQAANLHGERTRHRGTLLLSAPVTPRAILVGKSLPAFLATALLGAVITIFLGAGFLGFLASLSFLGFLYSATTYLAVISRSPRELSLSQVAMTTLLNVFLFLPAMFPSIPPVAFLSPVHVVASGIRGDPVTFGQFLYATLPLGFAAFALAAMSVGLLREELLFSVRSSIERFLDALAQITRRWWRVLLAGILVVPFVFAGEILVLVTTSVMGLGAAFLLFLPLSVLIEEAAKGIPIWARHRPAAGEPRRPWLLGILVGAGFFIGEKSYLVLTLVGFESLPFGREALALLGTGPGLLLLSVPLALHVVTAIILAYGSHRGRPWRALAFLLAFVVHFVYDQILLGGFV